MENKRFTNKAIRFGVFELDAAVGELRRRGVKIALQEQPLRVLSVLTSRPGEVVSREELRHSLYPNATFGDFDHGLNTAVNKIREALGDSASMPRFVETVPRLGYRFVAPVEVLPGNLTDDPPESRHPPLSEPSATAAESLSFVSIFRRHQRAVLLPIGLLLFTAAMLLLRHAPKSTPSVAVLPFVDLSPLKDQEYFSDGLTEDIINSLSQLSGLRVVARTSSFHFKGKTGDVRSIGKQLNVRAVLEGSVRKTGSRIKVNAQLIDTASGFQLWAQSYDRNLTDLFTVQEATAAAVGAALSIKASSGAPPRGGRSTEDLAAYNFYLEGRYFFNKRSPEDLLRAIGRFEQVIAKDPRYAPAYAGLADAYGVSQNWGERPPGSVFPKSRAAALRALELDDQLADAHLAYAHVLTVADHNWEEAAREFRRALVLDPRSAKAHHWYAALYLDPMGRLDEALAELHQAAELDPLAPVILTQTGTVLRWLGRDRDAVEQLSKALELDPKYSPAYEERALVHAAHFRPAAALSDLEGARMIAPRRSLIMGRLAYCYGLQGRRKEAEAIVRDLQATAAQRYVSPYSLGVAFLGAGDPQNAIAWLNTAVDQRDTRVISLGVDPVFSGLHSDVRFVSLLRSMNLPQPRVVGTTIPKK